LADECGVLPLYYRPKGLHGFTSELSFEAVCIHMCIQIEVIHRVSPLFFKFDPFFVEIII